MRLRVENLRITADNGTVIVPDLSFGIDPGEWFSIIGESGSGKSVTAMSVGNLLQEGLSRDATAIDMDGTDLLAAGESELRALRGSEIAYVFQDYTGAFTPYIRLGDQMTETIQAHESAPTSECRERAIDALNEVGLPGEDIVRRYPFQLSGGQLQRAAIATAMLLEPKLLIADEPTTALDAVTQASVLELINGLRHRYGCSVLFITHDLRCVIRHADRVAVMRSGEFVEAGPTAQVAEHPRNPYTRQLFAAVPRIESTVDRLPVDNA